MNLESYYGQFIKVYASEEEWFIGEPIRPTFSDDEEKEKFVFQIATSPFAKYKAKSIRLNGNDIWKIEELDERIQSGMRLTQEHVPDIEKMYRLMQTENLPRRVRFGLLKAEENDEHQETAGENDNLLSILSESAIEHEWIPHSHPILSAQDGADYFGIEAGQTAPTLILKSDRDYLAITICGDHGRIDMEDLKKRLDRSALRLAKPAEVEEATGFAIGSVPLIGHRLPTVLDRQLNRYSHVYGGTGNPNVTLKIRPADLERLNNVIAYIR